MYLPSDSEFINFCSKGADRFSLLSGLLNWEGFNVSVITTGKWRHLLLRLGNPNHYEKGKMLKIFTAHYDRYPNSPGANDNSASVFQLINMAISLKNYDKPHNSLFLFTDGEELHSGMKPIDQGANHLGSLFKKKGMNNCMFIVLDQCGIGETPIWSFSNGFPEKSLFRSILLEQSKQELLEMKNLYSDDLGFRINEFPSLRISTLPFDQAQKFKKKKIEPECWKTIHSVKDCPETLDKSSFITMDKLLKKFSNLQIDHK